MRVYNFQVININKTEQKHLLFNVGASAPTLHVLHGIQRRGLENSRKSLSRTKTIVAQVLTSEPICTCHQDDFKSKKADFHLVPI